MRWPQDAVDWPLQEHSRIVRSKPHRWHVQELGRGPSILLIHGAGGATQSWRDLMPLLASWFHVIAVDLPGQGFTQMGARHRCGLAPMAEDLASLVADQKWQISAIVGHSAGCAIALEMSQKLPFQSVPIVGINAALGNFKGIAGWLFPLMAKLLALNPFTARIFAATSKNPERVRKLIDGTGSTLSKEGLRLYQRLASDQAHVDATLAMMAQWSLDSLLNHLDSIKNPTLFLVGADDKTVPPDTSSLAANQMPHAQVETLTGYGHLVHEEAAETVAALIHGFLSKHLEFR